MALTTFPKEKPIVNCERDAKVYHVSAYYGTELPPSLPPSFLPSLPRSLGCSLAHSVGRSVTQSENS